MSGDWAEHFDELVELDPAAREERLDRLVATDPALAERLRALLAADAATAAGRLTAAAARAPRELAAALGAAGAALVPAPADRAGERVGAYRLVSPLGSGGMGEVWLAERADGEFESQVAIKLIRGDLASATGESMIDRFLRERRILAQLAHPGIARLLDGGRTESGEPYLVLEHVEGEPITEWCARRELPLPERIQLIVAIAAAVDFAHRALIVHRDIKPSNVLVDPSGQPKLLDFGIAKILEVTQPEAFDGGAEIWKASALTPAYAAPELILGRPVTTAADVYSLGVLLYELATRANPHPRRGGESGELARELDSETVAPPSSLAASGSPSGSSRRLWRDLDAILAKALARAPEERYASAAALADDLRRALADQPVEARGQGVGDRISSWLRRHRWVAAAGALSVVSLVGGLLVSLAQARAARLQASEARAQAARAEEIRSFLVSIFETSDPESARGGDRTARELLAEGARRVERELGGDVALRSEMLDLLVDLHRKLGLLDEARRLGEAAVVSRRELVAADPTALLRSRSALAWVRLEQGEAIEARDELRAVVVELERLEGSESLSAAAAREPLVEALFVSEGPAAALPEAVKRHGVLRARRGDRDVAAAMALSDLGVVRLELGDLATAQSDLKSALAVLEELLPADDPRLAYPHFNLGTALDRGGRHLDEAEREFREALRLRRSALGELHQETGLVWAALAGTLYERSRHAEAEEAARRAIAILENVDPFSSSQARGTLADVLMARGRPADALPEVERALRELESVVGAGHPLLANLRGARGRVLVALHRYAEARPELELAIGSLGESNWSGTVWFAFDALATAKRELGETDGIAELRARARAFAVARWGEGSEQVAHVDAQAALDRKR